MIKQLGNLRLDVRYTQSSFELITSFLSFFFFLKLDKISLEGKIRWNLIQIILMQKEKLKSRENAM